MGNEKKTKTERVKLDTKPGEDNIEQTGSNEFFTLDENGKKTDIALHEEILNGRDPNAPDQRAELLKIIGVEPTPELIDVLEK
jgi:hypothetical protein